MTDTTESQGPDLLYGCPRIAQYLGLTEDQIYHLARMKRLPTFKWGGKLCARRSTLAAAIAHLEAEQEAS